MLALFFSIESSYWSELR